jgi:signal peptide peptidase SppA
LAHSLLASIEGKLQPMAEDKEDEDDMLCIVGGFAVVRVSGVLMKNPGLIERLYYGAIDTDEVIDAVSRGMALPDTHSLVLDIDSPGGTVTGIPELGTAIMAANSAKPVFAFTDRLMASAAYWLAAGATSIYSTPSAELGSIGVYMPFYDYTEFLKQVGIKVELFTSGKYKGAGFPGTSLTEDQRDQFQSQINDIYNLFASHVAINRGSIESDDMQGQTYIGKKAVQKGFADRLVGNLDEVLKENNPRLL